jgi:hypothetical protein
MAAAAPSLRLRANLLLFLAIRRLAALAFSKVTRDEGCHGPERPVIA